MSSDFTYQKLRHTPWMWWRDFSHFQCPSLFILQAKLDYVNFSWPWHFVMGETCRRIRKIKDMASSRERTQNFGQKHTTFFCVGCILSPENCTKVENCSENWKRRKTMSKFTRSSRFTLSRSSLPRATVSEPFNIFQFRLHSQGCNCQIWGRYFRLW